MRDSEYSEYLALRACLLTIWTAGVGAILWFIHWWGMPRFGLVGLFLAVYIITGAGVYWLIRDLPPPIKPWRLLLAWFPALIWDRVRKWVMYE